MHRSQRDVGGEIADEQQVGSGGMILWPDPNNNPDTDRKVLLANNVETEDKMREWKQKLAKVGLLDEYDEQYLKPITGTGTFVGAGGKVDDSATKDPRSQNISEDLLAEVNQKFEGIPLAVDCMDDDIEQALMGDFDAADFEEIADDFVFEAAAEPEAGDKEAFDFDAHIQKLMDDAKKQRLDRVGPVEGHDFDAQDRDFFSKGKALHAVGEADEDDSLFGTGTTLDVTPGVVSSLKPDEERALCEQFEQALLEYDSDEMADLQEEEIHGDLPLEGDKQVEAALDDFLQEKDDDVLIQGKTHEQMAAIKKGGSGFSALVGTRMIPVKELDQMEIQDDPMRPISEVLQEARKKIQEPDLEPPPEEIFIDGKSYYSAKERNPWDCESILSTYSNLDNNPAMIVTQSRRNKKKKNKVMEKIILSSKTGLPIADPADEKNDESDYDEDYDETYVSVNKGVARQKKETPEEKRARKAQVKQERQVARLQKKVTKEVFKDEFLNRTDQGVTDDVGGVSVFRYT